jgi:MATE family multidrug resistance protein
MGSAGVLFVSAPRALAALFTDQPHIIDATVPLLRIAALFQLSDAIQAVAAGALRGAGDTRSTFIGNLVGHYAVGLPISVALGFSLGLGAPGIWWGLSAGLTVVAISLSVRFFWLADRPIARA